MELVVKDSAEALTEEPCLRQDQQMMMPNEEQPNAGRSRWLKTKGIGTDK
ncbi:MAG: hypothetical protein WKF59_05795 [Chitinophagaceae bacterium]